MMTVLSVIGAIIYTVVACRVFDVFRRRRKAPLNIAFIGSMMWPMPVILVGMLSLMLDDYKLQDDMSEKPSSPNKTQDGAP